MGAHGSASEVMMEQTSASEPNCSSPPPSHGRGRARDRGSAHGSGRGRATSSGNHRKLKSHGHASSSSNRPKLKTAIRKPRGRSQTMKTLQWIQPTPNEEDHIEQTSVSEETGRIAEASRKTAVWSGDANQVTSSEDDFATPAAVDGQHVPNTSGVFDYATWLVDRLTLEQRLKLAGRFTWIDLCAGLGNPFIVYEALRRGMLRHGLRPSGECKGLTEMSREKRAALRRRAVYGGSSPPIFVSSSDLTSRTPKDDEGN